MAKKDGKKMKQRIVYLDYLRIIAALAVIGIHVAGKGTYILGGKIEANPIIFMTAAVIDSCLRFAVPIFFMISGALVFSKPEMNISTFYPNRAKRILIPLLFWALFYSFVFNQGWPVREHFKQILLGNPFYHLWFLYAVIGIYLVVPVFYQFLKHSSKRDIEIVLGISFILNTILPMISSKFWVDISGAFSFTYLSGSIFYFLLGYYLINYDFKLFDRIWKVLIGYIISSLIISVLTVKSSLEQGMHATFYINTLWTLVIVQAASLFVLVKLLYQHFNKKDKTDIKGFKLVKMLGDYSMGVYLIHAFILEIYQRIWVVSYETVDFSSYIIHLVVGFIVVYFSSILVVMILKKIPIVKAVV